jgi:hypothetical protein
VNVVAHVSFGISLDQEINVALGVDFADGSVWANLVQAQLAPLSKREEEGSHTASLPSLSNPLTRRKEAVVRPDSWSSRGNLTRKVFVLWLYVVIDSKGNSRNSVGLKAFSLSSAEAAIVLNHRPVAKAAPPTPKADLCNRELRANKGRRNMTE